MIYKNLLVRILFLCCCVVWADQSYAMRPTEELFSVEDKEKAVVDVLFKKCESESSSVIIRVEDEQRTLTMFNIQPVKSTSSTTPIHKSISSIATSPLEIYQHLEMLLERKFQEGEYQKNYVTSPLFTAVAFKKAVDAMIKILGDQLGSATWLKGGTPSYFFVRKHDFSEGDELAIRGDLHGDARSLLRWLRYLGEKGWFSKDYPFRLAHKKYKFLFLGDYVDRGHYGAEVIWLIAQLVIHNPGQVFLVRGNHEQIYMNKREGGAGFLEELREKFKENDKTYNGLVKSIGELYDCLPVALLPGCVNGKGEMEHFICSHGAVQPGFNTKPLLDEKAGNVYMRLDKKIDDSVEHMVTMAKKLTQNQTVQEQWDLLKPTLMDLEKDNPDSFVGKHTNSFLWGDLDFWNTKPELLCLFEDDSVKQRSYIFCKKFIDDFLSSNKLLFSLRAHQHDTATIQHILICGNGLYKHFSEKTEERAQWRGEQNIQWSGKDGDAVPLEKLSVWTLNVAPCTGYYEENLEGFSYDTAAILRLAKGFSNWKFYPHQIAVVTAARKKSKDKGCCCTL